MCIREEDPMSCAVCIALFVGRWVGTGIIMAITPAGAELKTAWG
jgi:hypothetical protein